MFLFPSRACENLLLRPATGMMLPDWTLSIEPDCPVWMVEKILHYQLIQYLRKKANTICPSYKFTSLPINWWSPIPSIVTISFRPQTQTSRRAKKNPFNIYNLQPRLWKLGPQFNRSFSRDKRWWIHDTEQ